MNHSNFSAYLPKKSTLQRELRSTIDYVEKMENLLIDYVNPDKSLVVPPNCIPINADLLKFDFAAFAENFKEITNGRLFDVVLIDPPW